MPDENTPLLPKYDDLFEPTLEALTKLGGSGSIGELDEAVTAAIGASQEQLDVTYPKFLHRTTSRRSAWRREPQSRADRPVRNCGESFNSFAARIAALTP